MGVTEDVVQTRVGLGPVLATIRAHSAELAVADRLPEAVHRACLDAGLYRLGLAGELGRTAQSTAGHDVGHRGAGLRGRLGRLVRRGRQRRCLAAGRDRRDPGQADRRAAGAAQHRRRLPARRQGAADRPRLPGERALVLRQWRDSASWLLGGAMVAPEGPPLVAFFPADRARIVPNWSVSGLRATGSHDGRRRGRLRARRSDDTPGRWAALVGRPDRGRCRSSPSARCSARSRSASPGARSTSCSSWPPRRPGSASPPRCCATSASRTASARCGSSWPPRGATWPSGPARSGAKPWRARCPRRPRPGPPSPSGLAADAALPPPGSPTRRPVPRRSGPTACCPAA